MSQAPTPSGTARGYESPSVTQFSIFLPNRVGKLMELVKGFDDRSCRIQALAVHDASDHAVVRILCNNAAEARTILAEQGLSFIELTVLVVCLDAERTYSKMCGYLLSAELNIRFLYPLMGWDNGPAALALAIDDPTLAAQILIRKEFRLLGESDLPRYGE